MLLNDCFIIAFCQKSTLTGSKADAPFYFFWSRKKRLIIPNPVFESNQQKMMLKWTETDKMSWFWKRIFYYRIRKFLLPNWAGWFEWDFQFSWTTFFLLVWFKPPVLKLLAAFGGSRKSQRLIRVPLSTEFFSKRRKNYTFWRETRATLSPFALLYQTKFSTNNYGAWRKSHLWMGNKVGDPGWVIFVTHQSNFTNTFHNFTVVLGNFILLLSFILISKDFWKCLLVSFKINKEFRKFGEIRNLIELVRKHFKKIWSKIVFPKVLFYKVLFW